MAENNEHPKKNILPFITRALISSAYTFTSQNSIRILYTRYENGHQVIGSIDVTWKVEDGDE